MPCPHSIRDSPERCSQCLGIQPRRVDQHGAELVIDGEVARPIAQPDLPDYYRRGGRRGGKRPR